METATWDYHANDEVQHGERPPHQALNSKY